MDDRKLRFDVEVREGERTIGVGTHERRVVDRRGLRRLTPRIARHDRPRPGAARRPAGPAAADRRGGRADAGELSTILDHIEKIDELDLDGVEPTSHVVELENVLRPDEPRPSLPRERILEGAPDAADDGFRVPSPGARERPPRPHAAPQAAERVRAGELSARELFEAYRERAAGEDLNAFLWVADEAPDAPDGPLGGVPLAVKDLFCVEDVPSTAGSRILEGYRPAVHGDAVRKLREAGAPVLGKTNMDEFAMGSSNENSGFGPVKNPWDRARVPGGSSGGSAAAVAAGLAPWAIGTDTGGSIRQPAVAVRDRRAQAHLRRGLAATG